MGEGQRALPNAQAQGSGSPLQDPGGGRACPRGASREFVSFSGPRAPPAGRPVQGGAAAVQCFGCRVQPRPGRSNSRSGAAFRVACPVPRAGERNVDLAGHLRQADVDLGTKSGVARHREQCAAGENRRDTGGEARGDGGEGGTAEDYGRGTPAGSGARDRVAERSDRVEQEGLLRRAECQHREADAGGVENAERVGRERGGETEAAAENRREGAGNRAAAGDGGG
mmetsp:Transcript_9756/g.24087  ORF Transcript_9756/g.24087 Transcript_9756/m.24087 type:complete len:226 (-) Transcript_9756:3624-4301(-)